MIFIIINILLLSACCKDEMCVPDPDPCDVSPCEDTSKLMGKLDTLWTAKIDPNGYNVARNRSVIVYEDQLFFTNSDSPVGIIASFDLEQKGKLNWLYSQGNEGFINSYLLPEKGLLINKSWSLRLSIDISTGEGREYVVSPNPSGPRGILLGDNLYFDETEDNERTVHLRRSPVTQLEMVETMYTIDNSQINNSKKSIESMNLWIHPDTGDSILIFQHRMLNRVDVVVWNMAQSRIEWKHEDLTKDGNSNNRQIFLHDDKAYFGGSLTFYCFDMFTGEILWEFDEPNAYSSFSIFNSSYASSINAIIVRAGGDLYAFNPDNGSIRWKKFIDGSGNSGSPVYYDGIIYATSRNLLYSVRASNGQVLWSESSSRIPMGESNFRGELAIDPERRVLYATSRDKLFAIKLYED